MEESSTLRAKVRQMELTLEDKSFTIEQLNRDRQGGRERSQQSKW